MNIDTFMAGYQTAWQARDPAMFAALFHENGQYHNTPFQVQTGRAQPGPPVIYRESSEVPT
jgi:hypothetical protein